MSATHTVQDATGVIARADGGDNLIVTAASSPGAVAGYLKGCLWINTTSGVLYANTGTSDSAIWTAVGSQS